MDYSLSMKIAQQTPNSKTFRSRRSSGYVEISVFERIETPLGSIYWNPSKWNLGLAAAIVGAFLGLVAGSCLSAGALAPLASAVTGLTCATVTGLSSAFLVLAESGSLNRP